MKVGTHHSEIGRWKIASGNTGKIVSKETRKKMSEKLLGHLVSEETRRKISEARKGKTLPPRTEEHKEKLRLAWKDPTKHKTDGQIKGYYFSTKLNDNIPYRSSYELAYLKQLESDPLVVSYEYEILRISYQVAEKEHFTKPDFLVHYSDDHTELVEVKSDWCIDLPSIKAKLEAMKKYAEEHNWTFKLVTEKDLERLSAQQ